jgi:putative DNA primase/helicase
VSAVERLARADRHHAATAEQWDIDPWLLNTPGGVVDLRTGVIRPAKREDYMTKITAAAPGGSCSLWLSVLDRIMGGNQALIAYLQRWCGYCLTGVTSEHAMTFFYGIGRNGKGTFVETIAGALGDYSQTAAIETFLDTKNERHPTELAWLQGARLVTATETEEGRYWAESKLKQLTGGDRIAARLMRQDFFQYTPAFKLIVQGNHRPGLRTVDEAIKRRFNLVPFNVVIPPEERDTGLKEKLRAEWAGILAWAVEGCLAWQREGLNPPDAVRSATEDYFAQEDAMGRWLDDCCELRPNAWEPTSTLWDSWKRWAAKNNEFEGTEKAFSQNLESHGLTRARKNSARIFRGITLRGASPAATNPMTMVTDVTRPPITSTYARARENKGNPSHLSPGSPEPDAAAGPVTEVTHVTHPPVITVTRAYGRVNTPDPSQPSPEPDPDRDEGKLKL